jgi:Transposase DDE domain
MPKRRRTSPQAAVDGEAQIIVAHDVTQSAGDCGQLIPMTDAIEINLGRKPEQLSADAGYCSETNLEALENRNIDAYVATGRARDAVAGTVTGEPTTAQPSPEPAGEPTRVEAMRAKIKAGGHASPYRLTFTRFPCLSSSTRIIWTGS